MITTMKVYAERGAEPGRSLDGRGLRDVLETFMVHWIFGDDEQVYYSTIQYDIQYNMT